MLGLFIFENNWSGFKSCSQDQLIICDSPDTRNLQRHFVSFCYRQDFPRISVKFSMENLPKKSHGKYLFDIVKNKVVFNDSTTPFYEEEISSSKWLAIRNDNLNQQSCFFILFLIDFAEVLLRVCFVWFLPRAEEFCPFSLVIHEFVLYVHDYSEIAVFPFLLCLSLVVIEDDAADVVCDSKLSHDFVVERNLLDRMVSLQHQNIEKEREEFNKSKRNDSFVQ